MRRPSRQARARHLERAMAVALARPHMLVRLPTGADAPVDKPAVSSMVALVEVVEAGTKELDAAVDELRPRFQEAMLKGRENMHKVRDHIERVAKAVETIEDAVAREDLADGG